MFGRMPRVRPIADVLSVLELKGQGRTDREISAETGVPVNTIRTWRNHGVSRRAAVALASRKQCPRCESDPHELAAALGLEREVSGVRLHADRGS